MFEHARHSSSLRVWCVSLLIKLSSSMLCTHAGWGVWLLGGQRFLYRGTQLSGTRRLLVPGSM